jgi:F0F1-type ATP synthase epsilon subunit
MNYNNYVNTKNMFDDYGIDTNTLSPFANYSKMTPDVIISQGIKNSQAKIRQDIANANDNTKRLNMIMSALKNGTISPEEAQTQAKIYGLDFGSMNESNDTVRTQSQVAVNNQRIEKMKSDTAQNEKRIAILQQKVSQGRATSGDKAELNRLNIQNKKLIIEQNELLNQTMRNELNGNGNGGGSPKRAVGQKGTQKRNYAF